MSTVRQCAACSKLLSPTSRSKDKCSDCYKKSVQKQPVICAKCGKEFIPVRKTGTYCGLDCFNAARIEKARTSPEPPAVVGAVWVPLTQGKFALIDESDALQILSETWCAIKVRANARGDVFYAKNVRTNEYLHRFILGVTDSDTEVDHINGNGLNCRRGNIRRTDRAGNCSNKMVTVGKASGYKGVHINSSGNWVVRYMRKGREMCGGTFKDKDEAARKYDSIIRQYGDPASTLNFPRSGERSALTGEVQP